jgi:hypothetical protein
LAVVAVLGAGCDIEAESRVALGTFDRTLTVAGPVDLNILSRSGRIDVRAGGASTVRIVGRIRAHGSSYMIGAGYTPEEQVKSLESSPPVVRSGNTISVGDIRDPLLGDHVSISYEVTVPADTRLRTSSRSGEQTIEMIRGPVVASSRSGAIQVERVAGDVEIETRSGAVAVQLPSDGGATLDVETRSGAIDTHLTNQTARRHARRHVEGILGPGGRRLEVRTRSGSVLVR